MSERVCIRIDGIAHDASTAQTLAAVLMASHASARLSVTGEKRTPFCGMGVCGECRVTVDGESSVLACLVACRDGMQVETSS
jgi:aerobic-type carbon monoxide dehydrogenase small subunit (CoxS/CutS family)